MKYIKKALLGNKKVDKKFIKKKTKRKSSRAKKYGANLFFIQQKKLCSNRTLRRRLFSTKQRQGLVIDYQHC